MSRIICALIMDSVGGVQWKTEWNGKRAMENGMEWNVQWNWY
jgi:hypothetical protein